MDSSHRSNGLQQSMGMGATHAGQNASSMKYQDQPGGDTFSDFVSLVCQEAQNSQNQSNPSTPTVKSPTKLPQFFSAGMLPPPPPPPPNLARPVAILKTSDGQTVVGGTGGSGGGSGGSAGGNPGPITSSANS
ncbi:hypothetical protein Ahia01_000991800, partial [Argonauta hians]